MEIVNLPINLLKQHPRNSKNHPVDQVLSISESIKQFGFNNPIIIDSDNTILAGHGRFQAAKLLGLEEVPTISLSHLNSDEARAYIIADNKVSESTFDNQILKEELLSLNESGIEWQQLGFSEFELDKFEALRFGDEDDLVDLNKIKGKHKVLHGQVWKMGKHRIFVGARRLNIKKIFEKLKGSNEPLVCFLLERQAQQLMLLFKKDDQEVTQDIGL